MFAARRPPQAAFSLRGARAIPRPWFTGARPSRLTCLTGLTQGAASLLPRKVLSTCSMRMRTCLR